MDRLRNENKILVSSGITVYARLHLRQYTLQ